MEITDDGDRERETLLYGGVVYTVKERWKKKNIRVE